MDGGIAGEMVGYGEDRGWLALRNLILDLTGMTDEDKLKWAGRISGERKGGREGSLGTGPT